MRARDVSHLHLERERERAMKFYLRLVSKTFSEIPNNGYFALVFLSSSGKKSKYTWLFIDCCRRCRLHHKPDLKEKTEGEISAVFLCRGIVCIDLMGYFACHIFFFFFRLFFSISKTKRIILFLLSTVLRKTREKRKCIYHRV